MGYVVFIDTETTGLPPRGLPRDTVVTAQNAIQWNNCRLVQLAWEIRYEPGSEPGDIATMPNRGDVVMKRSLIVIPEGFAIPEEAAAIHGISTQKAITSGQLLSSTLEQLFADIAQFNVTKAVAHNMSFDENVLLAEMYKMARLDMLAIWSGLTKVCTMCQGTLPGQRWPKLPDLYERLCGVLPDELRANLHDATIDVHICADIYFALSV